MTLAILGAGNWGTTMALVLARAGHAVTLLGVRRGAGGTRRARARQ